MKSYLCEHTRGGIHFLEVARNVHPRFLNRKARVHQRNIIDKPSIAARSKIYCIRPLSGLPAVMLLWCPLPLSNNRSLNEANAKHCVAEYEMDFKVKYLLGRFSRRIYNHD